MRSAVRLFCLFVGMVFQQIPPLLLLVSYYLFLLLYLYVLPVYAGTKGGMLPVYAEKRRKRVTRICVENSAKSHKPVEKNDLPPMTIQRWVGTP